MATYYAIRIHTDSTSFHDESIGLRNGFFQWITSDPGYDGSVVLTGDVPVSADGQVWYSGIISKNGIGTASRRINIQDVGSYGTESDFEFQVNNTAGFWNAVKSQGIYLINRKIELFVVIENVFYLWWTGVIENNPFDELNFRFHCMDSFRKVHKIFPPNNVNATEYPDAIDSAYGQSIPVCIGKIPKAKVVNASGRPTKVVTGIRNGNNIYTSPAGLYDTPENSNPYIELYTQGRTFEASELGSGTFYLVGVKGTAQSVRIWNNSRTGQFYPNFTRIYLVNALDDCSADTYWVQGSSVGFPDVTSKAVSIYTLSASSVAGMSNSGVWYYQIIDLAVDLICSNDEIQSIEETDFGLPDLSIYNKEENSYEDISDLVVDVELGTTGPYAKPTISLASNALEGESGEFTRWFPIQPDRVRNFATANTGGTLTSAFGTSGSDQDVPEWRDRSRATSKIAIVTSGSELRTNHFVYFPGNTLTTQFDELYLTFEADISATVPFRLSAVAVNSDHFGLEFVEDVIERFGFPFHTSAYLPATRYQFNGLPNDYYLAGGNNNTEDSIWGYSQSVSGTIFKLKDHVKLNSEVVGENLSNTVASDFFSFQVTIQTSASRLANIRMDLKEYGFVGRRTINVFSEELYVKCQGEKLSASFVEYVPETFRLIMERYDGIHSSQVDISEISATHSDWTIGRQVTDPDSSYEYLNDLAAKTFIGIVPTRQGYRKLRPWRNTTTVFDTDSQNNILRDSISEFKGSELRNLFNDIEVQYAWNPGSKKYDKVLSVKKVDEDSFPSPYVSTGIDIHLSATEARAVALPDQVSYVIRIPGHSLSIGDTLSISGDTNGFNFSFSQVVSMSGSDVTVIIDDEPFTQTWTPITGTLLNHGSRIPKWTTFVGGIQTWVTGQYLWTLCHESFERTQSINPLPKEYSEVAWFIDESEFTGVQSDYSNTALKYLINLCEWTTRQKDIVNYKLPISSSYLSRELLDCYGFQDTYYTSGDTRQGWITMLQIDPSTDTLGIELTLNPEEVEIINIIDEQGADSDLIDEDGATDIIDEA